MGNFTTVAEVARSAAPAGGDGVFMVMGTMVGPASYDAAGSGVDFSAIFKSKVYAALIYVDNADVRCIFVPATAYATATPLCFVDDNAGTEATATDDLSTTCAVTHWIAWGTDG